MQPVNQRHIFDVEHVIGAAAVEVAVLMLAESLEIERFSVDKKFRAAHFDRAHAECLPIGVNDGRLRFRPAFRQQLHYGGVQICCARIPQLHVGNLDFTACFRRSVAVASNIGCDGRRDGSVAVQDGDAYLTTAARFVSSARFD